MCVFFLGITSICELVYSMANEYQIILSYLGIRPNLLVYIILLYHIDQNVNIIIFQVHI